MTETTSPDLTRRALARLRPDVQSMHAYAVQDARGLIKLDAMENPYTLPAALQAELGARLGALALNRYPGERGADLQRALAAHAGMPEGFALMLGNGSDELISLLAMACDLPGAGILAPLPGFVMYAMSAQLQGLKFTGVPLTADFALDVPAMRAAIARERPAILYLAYPNNPTGNLWDTEAVQALIDAQGAQGGLVVMDEAYQPFASHSWLDVIRREPAALVAEVDKVRPPYNISVLNCECALFALEHAEVFARQAQAIRAERAMLIAQLRTMPGVTVWPSDGNMILLRVPDPVRTFDGMKARGVLVKNVSRMHPLLANCLRLTVGTPQENAQMLAAIQASL
jgi:histidinol-phosphate aminotransferase